MKKNRYNISPFRMIEIVKDLDEADFAEIFEVSKAAMCYYTNGERNIKEKTLQKGLKKLGISMESFNLLKAYQEKLEKLPFDDELKFNYMLFKTLTVMNHNSLNLEIEGYETSTKEKGTVKVKK